MTPCPPAPGLRRHPHEPPDQRLSDGTGAASLPVGSDGLGAPEGRGVCWSENAGRSQGACAPAKGRGAEAGAGWVRGWRHQGGRRARPSAFANYLTGSGRGSNRGTQKTRRRWVPRAPGREFGPLQAAASVWRPGPRFVGTQAISVLAKLTAPVRGRGTIRCKEKWGRNS